ncbi:MAG: HNH endonuclease [Mariniphaga sp.]
MIHLNSKSIHISSVQHLNSVQSIIANEPTFEAKVKKADLKWNGKTSGAGKLVFNDIKTALTQMCVGVDICVYCEQNEATDIEHIFPKRLYPEKAFDWDNYVLACGKCNSHHKQDKFRIFNPLNSATEEIVTPDWKTYLQPSNDDSLFINQRIEDPMYYFELDLVYGQFIFIERFPIGTREFKKAEFTKDVLGLNSRPALVANRRNAAKFYISRLEKYNKAKSSNNFQ